MGMSHDFEVAIEEGSTCVRVGTAIFGGRTLRKNSWIPHPQSSLISRVIDHSWSTRAFGIREEPKCVDFRSSPTICQTMFKQIRNSSGYDTEEV